VSGSRRGSVNFIKKLATVQRAEALAVTGGFRTSPTDTLDTHSALLPINLGVEKVCHNAITRLATLPKEHLLHTLVKKSTKGHVKRHCSPLHIFTSTFRINPNNIEKIPPVHTHPKKRGLQDV
jgi:hypothetical protein